MVKVRDLCHLFLDRIQIISSFVNCSVTVCHDNIFKSHGHQKSDNSDTCCTGAGSYDLDVLDLLSDKLQCIDHSCKSDDRSTMLIIMEYRNITALFQSLLDLETSRG